MTKSIIYGALSALALLSLYFTIISLLSGTDMAWSQFLQFRYFIIALAVGFGIQIGLYSYMRSTLRAGSIAVSGTTSGVAMLSCCTHYLANVIPIIGVTGIVGLVAQYQIHLFWVGILFNLMGIAYIANKVIRIKK